jgi:LysR family transcriptional regulator, hydrogen peroxide-inducible genes activator
MDPNPSRLPSTKQLRYFAALAEHRHFGRAAASCFVSQSAFSVAIRELETLLGAQLVDRTNRRVTITATGQEVAVLARLCLQDLRALVAAVQAQSEPLHGPLKLGVIPTIAPFLLPHVLPAVREQYPSLKLFLVEDLTDALHAQLLEGKIDAMLVALPYELPGTESIVLFEDAFRLAARRGTKLIDPHDYRFNRLNAESVLLLREGHCLRQHAIDACRLKDPQKITGFSASSLLTLVEMVDADLGITFLPEMAVGSALLANTNIETYPLKDASFREIGLVWRSGSARGAEFAALGRFIAEHRRHGYATDAADARRA